MDGLARARTVHLVEDLQVRVVGVAEEGQVGGQDGHGGAVGQHHPGVVDEPQLQRVGRHAQEGRRRGLDAVRHLRNTTQPDRCGRREVEKCFSRYRNDVVVKDICFNLVSTCRLGYSFGDDCTWRASLELLGSDSRWAYATLPSSTSCCVKEVMTTPGLAAHSRPPFLLSGLRCVYTSAAGSVSGSSARSRSEETTLRVPCQRTHQIHFKNTCNHNKLFDLQSSSGLKCAFFGINKHIIVQT